MEQILRDIDERLKAGEPVALSSVIDRHGSLPMASRAKMIVHADGSTRGTVGGGCLEAEVYAAAREALQGRGARLGTFNLTEVEDGLYGHVCGGTVTILTEAVLPDDDTAALFGRLRELVEGGGSAALATRLPAATSSGDTEGPAAADGADAGDRPQSAVRVLVADAGDPLGALPESAAEVLEACRRCLVDDAPAIVTVADGAAAGRFYVEPVLPRPRVIVFGAGHCGLAIGELAHTSGFRVVLVDDRPSFASRERAPWADTVRVADFDDALADLDVGRRDHLVIVTRGHEHDLTVLRQVLGRPAAYLGMIGSERKRALFLKTLRADSVAESELDRLRSPMGLPIAADTPEEIAVAVVGEMIAVRRGAPIADGSGRASSRRPLRSRTA